FLLESRNRGSQPLGFDGALETMALCTHVAKCSVRQFFLSYTCQPCGRVGNASRNLTGLAVLSCSLGPRFCTQIRIKLKRPQRAVTLRTHTWLSRYHRTVSRIPCSKL